MPKLMKLIGFFLVCFVLTGCQKEKISEKGSYYDIHQYAETDEGFKQEVLEFEFDDSSFYFHKLNYEQDSSTESYQYKIDIPGQDVEVTYVDDKEMKTTSDYEELPLETLYISTDEGYTVVSVPTVYESEREYDSIQTVSDYEQPVQMTKDEDGYHIIYNFPKNNEYTSEFFYFQSDEPMFTFDEEITDILVRTELSGKFRLLSDGFYQISYDNYYPNGEGNYFRNCANYVAQHFLKYNEQTDKEIDYFNYMSYASGFVVDSQISKEGYFKTESRSEWLSEDFGIENGYYDTRFNADNAEVNLMLVERFDDPFFKEILARYGQFFIGYADEHSYQTDRGILVEDYYHPNELLESHVSLNHQLANLNVMLSMYEMTDEQQYLDTALLMLYGIEDTEDEWILENHDLNYALHYEGTSNVMKDYPYLTYNDLFTTKERLAELGLESQAIENLMASKLIYMKEQGITGYFE